jgi:hypothetical protein
MKVTFKSYDELKEYYTEDGKTLDNGFDWFLQQIGGKTVAVQTYKISGGGSKKEMFTIDTASVGTDGGFNTNTVFEHFEFPKDILDSVDYEGKTYYTCIQCGFTVQDTQRTMFYPSKTYADLGVENCVCPLCFTKSFHQVN